MAFEKDNFIPASAMANSSAGRMFSYRSTTDSLVTIKASGYFDDVAVSDISPGYGLRSKDFVLIEASDGETIAFINVVAATGVTTVASANDFA